MKAHWTKYTLDFIKPSGTSRGVMRQKDVWFIIVEKDGIKGVGECGLLKGLSADDRPDYEDMLTRVCHDINKGLDVLYTELSKWPSIQFALEQAFRQLERGGSQIYFDSAFSSGKKGIPINGLIWMGDTADMQKQIEQKIAEGFRCLKLKIGALDWQQEHKMLKEIRNHYDALDLEIRVDANGAFDYLTAEKVLDQLAKLEIHSIEQPIKAGQWEKMAALAEFSAVPVALDEELIGLFDRKQKVEMLEAIVPDYIILKPSFVGGWRGCDEWIQLAEENGIDWWITSALESNIGLNAIAQYTAKLPIRLSQGLGTGSLFSNNFPSPLKIKNASLWLEGSFTPFPLD
jgi:o-succinylbenzoate synthase